MRTILAAVLGFAVFVGGCGAALVGLTSLGDTTWSQDCGAKKGAPATVETASFTDDQLSYTYKFWDDLAGSGKKGCPQFEAELSYVYNYTTGDDLLGGTSLKDDLDEYRAVDFTLANINLKFNTQPGADAANGASFCGKTDWAVNAPVDLLGIGSATLANCSSFALGGGSTVTGLDKAYPFNVEQLSDTGAAEAAKAGLAAFSSIGLVLLNDMEQGMAFGRGNSNSADGKTAERRALTHMSATSMLLKQP